MLARRVNRLRRSDCGATTLEYVGVAVLIGIICTALFLVQAGRPLENALSRAVCSILDQHGCYIRRGAQGLQNEPGRGIVCALFEHELAREVVHADGARTIDPQLHTHALVANLAQGDDERWRTLDSRLVLRQYARTLRDSSWGLQSAPSLTPRRSPRHSSAAIAARTSIALRKT